VTEADPLPLPALQRQLKALVDDLRVQARELPELSAWLDKQYQAAKASRRTGALFEVWLEEQLDQAAVAWILGTVFVRFCEDNDLVSRVWLAGPGDRTEAAAEAQTAYFMRHPLHNDRHWMLTAFSYLRDLRATAGIFGDGNPVWKFPISGDAAAELVRFWRRGAGVHSFVDERLDTRFLGDLYQDLSQYARKRYALLQTPEFVEEFILNLTLDESIKEYGLEETSLIDPTCGSGHFLLGAFWRLHKLWEQVPNIDRRVRVQKVLDQVTGVDINPFAVSIAKFRLMVAALQACKERSLERAPGFRFRLATGDSLLLWHKGSAVHQGDLIEMAEGREAFAYFTEDADLLADYLRPGQYTVAVGNPPYITVKDKLSNADYRNIYKTCSGKYALSVPFAERFFQLVRKPDASGRAGFVGQITANSFMKREFGKKLIEDFFAKEVELSHVIDTSGAYIPGHGTPTVILAGRNRYPKRQTLRAVLGILGEPSAPQDPAKGLVWTAIVENVDRPGTRNPYVTIADLSRAAFKMHPWSVSGGGAADVKSRVEALAICRLDSRIDQIGVVAVTLEDEVFVADAGTLRRRGPWRNRPMVVGDEIRDYQMAEGRVTLWPYSEEPESPHLVSKSPLLRALWPFRRGLERRLWFRRAIEEIPHVKWYEFGFLALEKLRVPLSVVFAFVATHNHFVLDRGGKVFNRTAPVIKLPEGASEDDHLALLGLLNSSTACFWIKQVCYDRGNGGIGGGIASEDWERFYEFTGTKLQEFPIPEGSALGRARVLDGFAQDLAASRPGAVCAESVPTREGLDAARSAYDRIRGAMIAEQEELDWEVYRLYGLLREDLTAPENAVPRLKLGERAFEIVLARKVQAGEVETEWFARHGSTPITEIPEHWPAAYREVIQRRISIIEERSDIALIERPECKRRWASVPWENQEKEALRTWLLDRLEAEPLWRDSGRARVLSVAQLADRVGVDQDFRDVLTLYCRRDDYDIAAEVTRLVADEAVPYLAAYRYKPSGLRKRALWERTWEKQRQEDAGEPVGPIDVPPKYSSADFAKPAYWRNRGKLDVPKERFILYPKAGRGVDKTPVIGWAGWDHLDQAQALATLYFSRKTEDGWPAERLLPLLAGLVELEPWLHQWHHDPTPGYPGNPAEFYTGLINAELNANGHSRADLVPDKLR